MDHIGQQLKHLRTERGMSQRKLAAAAGVSNATISLIEHGRTDPSMGLLKRVLDCLGVSFAEFFATDAVGGEKVFFKREELSEISSGQISYRQVGGISVSSRVTGLCAIMMATRTAAATPVAGAHVDTLHFGRSSSAIARWRLRFNFDSVAASSASTDSSKALFASFLNCSSVFFIAALPRSTIRQVGTLRACP